MKRIKAFIFLALLAVTVTGAGVHKFYVAIFQLDYVPEKQVVQMTARIFTDDLEHAFKKKYGKKFYLATRKEIPETKEYLKKYFTENIRIKINGNAVPVKYLGKETEDDVLVCYYTLEAKKNIKSVEMTNTTLFDMYTEQQNMIHTEVGGNKKSLLLTYDKPTGTLDY